MKLYYSQGACSLAPHIILEELGISYTAQQLSGDAGDFARPEFLKLSPMGYVPVLELSNGEVLTEGVAIQNYLADQKPELNLAPRAGSFERVRLNEWMTLISTEIHKGIGALFAPKNFCKNDATVEEVKTALAETIGEKLDILERKVAGKKYVMGETFTIADAYLFTVFGWTKYVGLKRDRWPNLVAHGNRVAERPAVRRALAAEDLLD